MIFYNDLCPLQKNFLDEGEGLPGYVSEIKGKFVKLVKIVSYLQMLRHRNKSMVINSTCNVKSSVKEILF